jgi:hypothetical protein
MNFKTGIKCNSASYCEDGSGCPEGRTPDFCIKRHDTRPEFKVSVEDCDGPFEENENVIVEVNMWAKGKLKKDLDEQSNYFYLADNIGFDQIMIDDIIVFDQIRSPEQIKVIGFDETNKAVFVERGYNETIIQKYSKGSGLKIFRAKNLEAQIEYAYEDILQTDGSIKNQLVNTFLICNWNSSMTCLPGCFWLEFKMIKLNLDFLNLISFTPSMTINDYGCGHPAGVEWIRRFPLESEGFLIKINDTPTAE